MQIINLKQIIFSHRKKKHRMFNYKNFLKLKKHLINLKLHTKSGYLNQT